MDKLRNGIDKIVKRSQENHNDLYNQTKKSYESLTPKQQQHFDYLMGKELDPFDFPYSYNEETDTFYLDDVEEKEYKKPKIFDDTNELKHRFEDGTIDQDVLDYIWKNLMQRKDMSFKKA